MQEDAPTTNPADNMTARDGTQWQRTPRSCQQVRSHNLFRDRCGPTRITENMMPLQCFKSYLTVEMVDIIVRHTNRKAHATYNAYSKANPNRRQLKWKDRIINEIYLFAPYYGSGRNITMDNFFTTLPLARELKVEKLSIVGTLRRNKAKIPAKMKEDKKKKDVSSSLFGFHDNVPLLSYKQRNSNSVILLSSMHDDAQIDENGKPEVINFYKQTKGGVDVMDQTLQEYTTQRQTRRWSMAFFDNIIDVSAFASHIIYYGNNPIARYTTTHSG